MIKVRMKESNICIVKEFIFDGKDNGFCVYLRNGKHFENRNYKSAAFLPVAVKKFCEKHNREIYDKTHFSYRGDEWDTITYVYR